MSINDYKLEKQIGSGSFGDVYRGVDKHSGMKVAIKRIRKKILYENGQYLLRAYYREIDCMKKCECENSIRFIRDFQTQNNYNIIMELCDTDLLCHLYQRPEPFTVDEIRLIFSQLNNVFKKMQQHKIIHRDLKLGNILIKFTDESKKNFIPKLSDYGFSKELNNYNFAANTHLGTPATMAPEIIMNYPYNEKSDLWSVGVMMYQLYYKQVPYEGNTEQEILSKINGNVPFNMPEDEKFADLINRLLVVNVQNRISWDQYFVHPFFTGKELDCELGYTFSGNNEKTSLYNSISFNPNDNKLSMGSEEEQGLCYSFSANHDNFFVQGGDIYRKTESNSSKNLFNFQNFQNRKDFESRIELLERGSGITDNAYRVIIESCIEVQDSNKRPMAQECINRIKSKLNGDWLVFIADESDDNYDFYISFVVNHNNLVFKYGKNEFQVCQIN
jgi:serine/threonine protein kinase